MIGKLQIEVSQTATGQGLYVQIRSPGAIPVNIVLIADEVEVLDRREPKKVADKKSRRATEARS